MKSFALHPYELKRVGRLESRRGYLLRIEEGEGAFGYADIFPWTQFGDPSYEQIPDCLRKNQFSPLLMKSIEMAKRDGQARKRGESLFKRGVSNHFLVDQLDEEVVEIVVEKLRTHFSRVKIKIGRDPEIEMPLLEKLVSQFEGESFLRLDLNGLGSEKYLKFLETLSRSIDYVEDPSGDSESWKGLTFEIAYDHPGFAMEGVPYQWQIIKPAKQGLNEILGDKVVFTSYLGHPVGQTHGMIESLLWGPQKWDYGFLSHTAYEINEFSERFVVQENTLSLDDGLGIGFGDLFEKIKWTPVL